MAGLIAEIRGLFVAPEKKRREVSDQYVISRTRPVDPSRADAIGVRYLTPRELASVGAIDLTASPAPRRDGQVPQWAQGTIFEGMMSGSVNTIGGSFNDIFAPFQNMLMQTPNITRLPGIATGQGANNTTPSTPSAPVYQPPAYVPVAGGYNPPPPTIPTLTTQPYPTSAPPAPASYGGIMPGTNPGVNLAEF